MADSPYDQFDTPPITVPPAPPSRDVGDMVVSLPRSIGESIVSTGAGFGRGVGNVALTGQDWLGQAASSFGATSIGDWLQKDAAMGQKNLTAEAAPYQERNPYAFGAGKIGGEVTAMLPVLRAGGKGLEAANLPTFGKAFQSGGMEAPNAFMRLLGGGTSGAATSALTDPDNIGLGTVIGAVVPTGAAPLVNKVATKIAEKAVPATQDLKDAAKKLYQSMDASGVRIVQPIVQQLSAGMDNFVKNTQQYLAKSHTAVNTALDELKGFATEPLSITRLNTYYKNLRKSAARTGGAEGSVLDAMADTVNEFMDRLSPRELGGASARDVANLRAANDLQHRAYKSKVIDDILHKATTRGEGEVSNVSTAQAIQKGFEDLFLNEKKMAAFTPEERALIEKVAKGDYKTKILRMLSSLKPGMQFNTKAFLYALGGASNLPAATAVAAGAGAANMWRNALLKNQGKNVSLLIRNKGPVTPAQIRPPFALTPAGVSAAQQAFPSQKRNAMAR